MKKKTNAQKILRMAVMIASLSQSVLAEPTPAARVEANCVAEVALVSVKNYVNPFMEVELDAVVTRPDGTQLRVPGF